MKNILLVDTNFSSFPLYIKLRGYGYNVYVIGNNKKDYLASEAFNYIQEDYTNSIILEKVVRDFEIDYIIPGCNDQSYLACASLKKEYLTNIDPLNKVRILFDKYEFRKFCIKNDIPSPRLYSLDELNKNKHTSAVIKPVDSYSGKGITILKKVSKEGLRNSIKKAKRNSRSGGFLIEEYVDGKLYSHSAFIQNGKIIQDFVVAEFGSANPLVVDTSYVDTSFPKLILNEIRVSIEKIAQKLSLCDGLIHTQFIRCKENFWLIEVTRRCPGDLYSFLIEESTGFDYCNEYIAPYTGVKDKKENGNFKLKKIIRHTISQKSKGIFFSVCLSNKYHLVRYIQTAKCGDYIKASPEGRIGVVFIGAECKDEFHEILRDLLQRVLYRVDLLDSSSK